MQPKILNSTDLRHDQIIIDAAIRKIILVFSKISMESRQGCHRAYNLEVHLVWITKYRYNPI